MLERIISKEDEKRLLQGYWEKKPMILKSGDPDRFSQILCKDKIDEILATTSLENLQFSMVGSPEFKMFGGLTPEQMEMEVSNRTRLKELFIEYSKGTPINIGLIEKNCYPILQLTRDIELAIKPIQIATSALLIPKRAKQFSIGFENDPLFLLNISGEAEVKAFHSQKNRSSPVNTDHDMPDEFLSRAGDFVYIPKASALGFKAKENSPAIFLCIAFSYYTFYHFLKDFITHMAEKKELFLLRKSLPIGLLRSGIIPQKGSKEWEEFHQVAQNIKEVLAQKQNLEPAQASILKRHTKTAPPTFRGHLHTINDLDHVTLETLIQRNEDANYLIEEGETELLCHYSGEILTFPISWSPGLHQALNGKRIQIKDLEGELSLEEKLTLAKDTIRHGLAKIIHHKTMEENTDPVLRKESC